MTRPVGRRRFLGGLVATGIAATAGCTGSSGPMAVTDTRLAHEEDKIGVFATLEDRDQNRAGSVTVHAELLDVNNEVIEDREKEFDVGGRDEANVIVWFEELPDDKQDRVEGAWAEVVS